jgi:hypothetical protein
MDMILAAEYSRQKSAKVWSRGLERATAKPPGADLSASCYCIRTCENHSTKFAVAIKTMCCAFIHIRFGPYNSLPRLTRTFFTSACGSAPLLMYSFVEFEISLLVQSQFQQFHQVPAQNRFLLWAGNLRREDRVDSVRPDQRYVRPVHHLAWPHFRHQVADALR